MARPVGSFAHRAADSLDPGTLRRMRTDWLDPERTQEEMRSKYGMSVKQLARLCSDLPPRFKDERLKRQAPLGLRRLG